MKRSFILSVVLAALICLLGCGNDRYAIEKRYWHINKEAGKIFNNPESTPPNQLEGVVKHLGDFAKEYPDSSLAIEADLNIARLYIIKQEYGKARGLLRGMLEKYKKSDALSSEIIFFMGNSYETEDNWNSALAQYQKIMVNYPLTIRGWDMPLYIAMHYKSKYQPDRMVSAFREAIAHYGALAQKYPDTLIGYNADSLVAKCFIELGEWNNAIAALDNIIGKYRNQVSLDYVIINKAILYANGLKDKEKAIEILNQMLKDYPKSPLSRNAKMLIKSMEKK